MDAIVTPTSPTAAFKIGESRMIRCRCISDVFTISATLRASAASAAVWVHQILKLPIGLQLLGKPFGEETMLKIAHAYEQTRAGIMSGQLLK